MAPRQTPRSFLAWAARETTLSDLPSQKLRFLGLAGAVFSLAPMNDPVLFFDKRNWKAQSKASLFSLPFNIILWRNWGQFILNPSPWGAVQCKVICRLLYQFQKRGEVTSKLQEVVWAIVRSFGNVGVHTKMSAPKRLLAAQLLSFIQLNRLPGKCADHCGAGLQWPGQL